MAERLPGILIKRGKIKKAFIERLAKFFAETTIYGEENLKEVRTLLDHNIPVELFPNHLSHADSAILNTEIKTRDPDLEARLIYLMGTVVLKNLVTRNLVPYNGIAVPSQRRKPNSDLEWEQRRTVTQYAFSLTQEALENGKVPVVFAEGSRSREKGMTPVKEGISRYLYLAPDIHVVPIGIWGTENVLPVERVRPRHAQAFLHFGRPIPVSELEARARQYAMEDEINGAMVSELMYEVAQLLPQEYRGEYVTRPEDKGHLPFQ